MGTVQKSQTTSVIVLIAAWVGPIEGVTSFEVPTSQPPNFEPGPKLGMICNCFPDELVAAFNKIKLEHLE
jgi:hypothetical protein